MRQTGVTTERTVRELADVAFSNMADYFEKDGQTLKNIHEMPEGAQRAISEIVIDQNKKDGIKRARLKLHSKEGPADKLMKHLGGYDQHNRQKGPLEVVERLPSKKSPYLVADVRIDRSQNRRTAS